jgi:tight adherence protein C
MELGPATLSVITFGLIGGAAASLYAALFWNGGAELERLLEPAASGRSGTRGRSGIPAGYTGRFLEACAYQWTRVAGSRLVRSRELLATLRYAGYSGIESYTAFRLVQTGMVLLGAAAGLWMGWVSPLPIWLTMAFGVVLGMLIPIRALRLIGAARQGRITRELPAVLDLLAVSLEAGVGLTEAIKMVSRGCSSHSPTCGSELRIAVAQMGNGSSLSDSLEQIAERTGSEDLRSIMHLLIQSEQLGARLAPALRAGAEQLAVRRRIRAEERAHKASVKMLLPLVLLILPAMLIVMLGPAFIQLMGVLGG